MEMGLAGISSATPWVGEECGGDGGEGSGCDVPLHVRGEVGIT